MDFENNIFSLTREEVGLSRLPAEFTLEEARELMAELLERARTTHEEGIRLRASGEQVDKHRAASVFIRSANMVTLATEIARRLEIESGIESFEDFLKEN
jgi:hypothetical protein